jgi:hypothetical protein
MFGDGIDFLPSASTVARLSVSNTLVSDNASFGINISATGSGAVDGMVDHVDMERNFGAGLQASNATGIINVTVADSVAANGFQGIFAVSSGSTLVNVMVRNSTVANNSSVALGAQNTGANLRVTRSSITGNGTGWFLFGSGTPLVTSYLDNNIDGNTNANTTPGSTASPK